MDEMQALRSMRADVEPPAPLRLAGLRAGLFRSMTAPPPRRGFGLPRLAWRLGVAGGLAAALLAGITVAQGNGPLRPEPANAAAFLGQAAAAVAKQPSDQARPRDDQWVYTKHLSTNVTVKAEVGEKPSSRREVDVQEDESWFRFDGKEIAGVEPGGQVRRTPLDLEGYDDRYPAQVWDYHASLPLDPDQLLRAVHDEVKRIYPDNPEFHSGQGLNNRTVWLIGVLLGDDTGVLPSPELQAALYRALAKVPGVTATEGVTDLAGRESVLLSHRWRDYSFGILVDPESYALLGTSQKVKDGKVVEGSALLKAGIVDEAGERP
jgi:hypothetical protein